MQRKIYSQLLNWKNTNIQKPLMIIGAGQIGKTYIINEKSSTTGNIYGIFDMSCGLAEYTAAYINNLSYINEGKAFATGESTYLATTYPNKSTTNDDFNTAYVAKDFKEIYGDTIWETSQDVGNSVTWFKDSIIIE